MFTDILTYYQGKRILVTGGRGYLGSNLIDILKSIDCSIIRLSRTYPISGHEGSVAEINDMAGDIRQPEVWKSILDGTEIVFHFASQTSVYVADEDPVDDFSVNVSPLIQLLECCRKHSYKPIILFSGTVTEAGMPIKLPVDESHPDKPITIYDLHKLMAEQYLKYYCNKGIVKGTILRLANVYGPGPKSNSADRGVLNMMIQRALKGEDLTLYGKGDNHRDYIYVKDVIRAFLIAATRIEDLNGRHFVIGSGKGHTLKDAFGMVVEGVKRNTGKDVSIVEADPPPSQSQIDARNFVADYSRFCQLTNWVPNFSLRDGINKTIEYFKTI